MHTHRVMEDRKDGCVRGNNVNVLEPIDEFHLLPQDILHLIIHHGNELIDLSLWERERH